MWTRHPGFAPTTVAPAPRRCWADGSFRKTETAGVEVGIECSALGEAALGLCKRHALEILGRIESLIST